MLKGIFPVQHAATADDFNFFSEPHIHRADIGKSRRFYILPSYSSEAVFRFYDHFFSFSVDVKPIADGIDTIHILQRKFIENLSYFIKMSHIKIRRKFYAKRFFHKAEDFFQDFFCAVKIIAELGFSGNIGAGQIKLHKTSECGRFYLFQHLDVFLKGHSRHGEENGLRGGFFLVFQDIIQIVVQPLVGQSHRIDTP